MSFSQKMFFWCTHPELNTFISHLRGVQNEPVVFYPVRTVCRLRYTNPFSFTMSFVYVFRNLARLQICGVIFRRLMGRRYCRSWIWRGLFIYGICCGGFIFVHPLRYAIICFVNTFLPELLILNVMITSNEELSGLLISSHLTLA